jgi:hypothetical protein
MQDIKMLFWLKEQYLLIISILHFIQQIQTLSEGNQKTIFLQYSCIIFQLGQYPCTGTYYYYC